MWEYFSYERDKMLGCPCCGAEMMNDEFMQRLDRLRDLVGFPLRITSGYRCPVYNDKIAASGRGGPHTTGRAVDLLISGGRAWELVGEAIKHGFTGVGVKQKGPHAGRFIHLDDLAAPEFPRPVLFSY